MENHARKMGACFWKLIVAIPGIKVDLAFPIVWFYVQNLAPKVHPDFVAGD